MTYKVVQKQKNGNYYLYEARGVWDPVKKNSVQKRVYIGVCDKDGNLLNLISRILHNYVFKEPGSNRQRRLSGLNRDSQDS